MNTTPTIVRSEYMQSVLDATYPNLAVEAIKGGFDGAWERLISAQLRKDYIADHSEANEIVESVMVKGDKASQTYLKAAYLITSSKIPSEDTADIGIE